MTYVHTNKPEEKRYRIERIYGDCLERIGIRNLGGDGYAIVDKNIVPEVGDIVHCMKPQQNVGGYIKQVKRIEGGTITVGTAYLDETRDYEFEAGEIIGVVVETYGAFPHYREYVRASRDVVEVVRCKDCAHYHEIKGFDYKGRKAHHCVWHSALRGENDYCSDGIRREG